MPPQQRDGIAPVTLPTKLVNWPPLSLWLIRQELAIAQSLGLYPCFYQEQSHGNAQDWHAYPAQHSLQQLGDYRKY
jgi:hypothetical protein